MGMGSCALFALGHGVIIFTWERGVLAHEVGMYSPQLAHCGEGWDQLLVGRDGPEIVLQARVGTR